MAFAYAGQERLHMFSHVCYVDQLLTDDHKYLMHYTTPISPRFINSTPPNPTTVPPAHRQSAIHSLTVQTLTPRKMASQAGSRSAYVATSVMYGIIITEKSSALAFRKLVHGHHAHYLALRIIGNRLPTELIDLVADALTEELLKASIQLWNRMKRDPKARFAKFSVSDPPGRTAEEKGAWKQLSQFQEAGTVRVDPLWVTVTKPDGRNKMYVHLSAGPSAPQTSMIIPGSVVGTGGPAVKYADQRMSVKCSPGQGPEPSVEEVEIELDEKPGAVTRLTQLDQVEAAIQGWDQESVERFVKKLDVKVAAIEGEEGGGLKPRLRLLQHVAWV